MRNGTVTRQGEFLVKFLLIFQVHKLVYIPSAALLKMVYTSFLCHSAYRLK